MAHAGTINLISTKIENTPELSGMYPMLRKLGYGSFIVLIASGIIVGGIFAYLSARQQGLSIEKGTLTARIGAESIKEGLILTAKQRVAVVDKILADQKHLSTFFDLIQSIVSAGQLNSLALDENNKAVITVHVDAIGDAITVVDALLAHVKSNAVTKPELTAFTVPKEGGFDMTVSFVPKL